MFKSNLIAAMFGIVLVCGFLGFLMWWLKSVPLTIIMLGVIGLVIYDVVRSLKESNGSAGG
jgi:hypothetical protein